MIDAVLHGIMNRARSFEGTNLVTVLTDYMKSLQTCILPGSTSHMPCLKIEFLCLFRYG
jgi:hypothetical protein